MYPEIVMAQEASSQRQRLIPAPVELDKLSENLVVHFIYAVVGVITNNIYSRNSRSENLAVHFIYK